MARVDSILQVWHHHSPSSGTCLVFPDGCRDLIGRQLPGQAPRWMLSPLMDQCQAVSSHAGEQLQGYRLLPGARIHGSALLVAVASLPLEQTNKVLEQLNSWVSTDESTQEALQALASEPNLKAALKQWGASERSMQRLLITATGRPPLYWRRLARLRQLARGLRGASPLAALAADHGFSDQAHMNRECRQWVGKSPGALRQDLPALTALCEPGFG